MNTVPSAEDMPSLEETDQLHQNIKKYKRRFVEEKGEDIDMAHSDQVLPVPEEQGLGV